LGKATTLQVQAMENDLSLSQSFGGLRIANPDESRTLNASTPTLSPTSRDIRTTPDPQSQSRRHSIFNILRRGESPADPPSRTPPPPSNDSRPLTTRTNSTSSESTKLQTDSSVRTAAAKAYRQSMPLHHQAQQQAQFPPYQSSASQSGQRGYTTAMAVRPVSGVYSAQPPPNAIPTRDGSYRLRSESSKSSIGGIPTRSDSRGGTAMQAGVPSREPSHRDRSYSQNHPIPTGNGPLPLRHSSRGMGGGHVESISKSPTNASTQMYDNDGRPIPSNEEWKDNGAANVVREEYDGNGKLVLRQAKKGVRDFVFGRTLGEGSYSTVVLATDRQTLKEYAVKILDKKHIIKEKKIKYVNIERDTLNRLIEHPGIVRLYYTFQDSTSLYYVLDIASGGELLAVLKKISSFDEECTRFYGAQILDAIEHMHKRGVIHRDLKPENVLLDDHMHIKITDFGTAKLLPDPREPISSGQSYDVASTGSDVETTRARSFVGTAEYVSPELLTDKNACKASDLWAFGCIIYQLLSGRPPFKAANEYQTFQKIVGLDYDFPPGFPFAARDLVERLLVLDPQRRLSIEHIKNHEFFDGIEWGRGLWKIKAPRLKPYVPLSQEPTLIKLNGYSAPQPIVPSRAQAPSSSNGAARLPPRIITELPPPTQLDIEWSPVLTRNNERILKLGNLMVLSTPLPHSPNSRNGDNGDAHEKKKLSRFFGGSTTKKRQRLVMVTSSARIILAAAGGEEKKTKMEISLLASECLWRTQIDAKGQNVWCIDTVSPIGFYYLFQKLM
jgi:3-phosphoinositide dependent protein kinase-1